MSVLSDIAEKLSGQFGKKKDEGTPLEPIKAAQDMSFEEKKLVSFIREKLDLVRSSSNRIAIEGIYLTNVAYLMGFDGVYYDSTYRQFKNADPRRKLTRNRFKVNKILPTVQNRLARLTQSPPRYDIRPNSNDTEDKDAARLGMQILTDIFHKERFDEKRQDLVMSAMQGGHSYLQVLWDPSKGKPMIDPETEQFTGYEGDVRLEVLNCLEVFPDPTAKTLDDCAFIIKAKVRKLEYFKERYPDRGGAVKEEDAWLLSSIYDMRANALTAVGVAGAQTASQMKNCAIEIVYYEKRSEKHPNGRMISVGNGILLEDKEMPIGEYDLIKFDDIMIGGRYNSEAVITHLRPIQDQYNILRTKMADWVRKMLAGKYLAAKGAGLMQEAINNDSGEVVEYNPVPNAAPPMAMTVPMIPQYAYKDLEVLDAEFDAISGINEISRGVLPSASIPASGMAFLQEQDQTRIGVQTYRNEVGFAKVGQAILNYVSRFYEMPRLLKMSGEGMEYTVKEFVGEDLRGNCDCIVIPGSTIPTSKVLRRQDILNEYQMGLMGDPADPKLRARVHSMMEFGNDSEMWKEQALDEAQVKKVIRLIEQGDQQATIEMLSEFDNQTFHLQEMNTYRKTDKYQKLDKPKRELFKFVMEWRLNALIGQTNPQIGQAQTMAETMANGLKEMPNTMTGPQPMIDANGSIISPPPIMQQTPNPNMQTLKGELQ